MPVSGLRHPARVSRVDRVFGGRPVQRFVLIPWELRLQDCPAILPRGEQRRQRRLSLPEIKAMLRVLLPLRKRLQLPLKINIRCNRSSR
ncbi:hypothetical protein, partial [Paraglaciecola polaris]|uniref:hypothetical protein n=1 Tax=Paraglaciecola polaris TaxID=222814 RepID=UPI001D037894